ncbi:MAG: 3'-5' exonuclease, partial [Wenzhouxiangellaceae bacterium]
MKPLKRWRWWCLDRQRGQLALTPNPLARRLPSPATPVSQAPMLAIDLEMTGLAPDRDAIITIGWVPIEHGRIMLEQACEIAIG